jgi:hypothetical protein
VKATQVKRACADRLPPTLRLIARATLCLAIASWQRQSVEKKTEAFSEFPGGEDSRTPGASLSLSTPAHSRATGPRMLQDRKWI